MACSVLSLFTLTLIQSLSGDVVTFHCMRSVMTSFFVTYSNVWQLFSVNGQPRIKGYVWGQDSGKQPVCASRCVAVRVSDYSSSSPRSICMFGASFAGSGCVSGRCCCRTSCSAVAQNCRFVSSLGSGRSNGTWTVGV